MQTAIAIVKLAPGQVGYYDELSRVHLTMSRPKTTIYDYMNTSAILRSIKNRTLILESGTLNPVSKEASIDEVIKESLETPTVMEPIIVEEEVKVEEPIVETKTTKKEKTTASKAKQSKKREE